LILPCAQAPDSCCYPMDVITERRMTILAIVAWALVFGISPGLALIGIALTALALDRYDPGIIDRVAGGGRD